MSIQFNCPQCQNLIAFEDQHAGKYAHCEVCQQRFVIPNVTGDPAKKIAPEPTEEDLPKPDFYRAALVESWRLFVRPGSATGLVFVVAALSFKFFCAHIDYSVTLGPYFRLQLPVGWVIRLAAWGGLFWYYLEVISDTAMDLDEFPGIDIEGFFEWAWAIIRSLSMFACVLVVSQLPTIGWRMLSGVSPQETSIVATALSCAGLFFVPIFILMVGAGTGIDTVVHPSALWRPIRQAFGPYLLIVLLVIGTWQGLMLMRNYGDLKRPDETTIALHLGLQIVCQGLALYTARVMGLFYRHFQCYMR